MSAITHLLAEGWSGIERSHAAVYAAREHCRSCPRTQRPPRGFSSHPSSGADVRSIGLVLVSHRPGPTAHPSPRWHRGSAPGAVRAPYGCESGTHTSSLANQTGPEAGASPLDERGRQKRTPPMGTSPAPSAATPGEPRVNPSAGWALKTQTPARRLPGRGSIGEGAAGAVRFS